MANPYYNHIGNYADKSEDVLAEYVLSTKPGSTGWSYTWPGCKYDSLPPTMKFICEETCAKSGYNDLLTNPYVIVERHHNILIKNGTVKNSFGTHTDRDGPAGTNCRSILYYYKIDPGIDNSELNFYDEDTSDESKITCKFHPISGDLISFDDNIFHCPGNFKTDSVTPVVRGVIAVFIITGEAYQPPKLRARKINDRECCTIS